MNGYFLQRLAETIYHQYDAENVDIVFPNRRAGLFFRQYLADLIDKPIWSPRILSIEDFAKSIAGIQKADNLTLIFRLYQVYSQYLKNSDTFDQFYYWGGMLLSDFDDIDKNLADAKRIFVNLQAQKELDYRFDYLDEDHRKLIQSFWSSFGAKLSSEQKHFLELWKILPDIYQEFRQQLIDQGIGYNGLIFRQASQKIQSTKFENKIIFAGINALNNAERKIIDHLVSQNQAHLFWDIDAYYLENKQHEAGFFFRTYQKDHQLSKSFPAEIPDAIRNNTQREINIFGFSSEVGQVKKMSENLADLAKNPSWNPQKTAIILTDENLLLPVLNSLPPDIGELNVTMGFPLKNTPQYDFINHLIQLQRGAKVSEKHTLFPYKHILALLKHAFFSSYQPESAKKIAKEVIKSNQVYVNADKLQIEDKEYPSLFVAVKNFEEFYQYLINILLFIYRRQEQQFFEREMTYHIYILITRIKEIAYHQHHELDLNTFAKLIKQVIQITRIPFSGEPLKGLQIMGVLETRNLDFENVFILSMNEGNFPAAPNYHSYIPYNLRKAFGLPTFDQQDAIYSYYFYRLLQKSKNVNLFYNTVEKSGLPNEMSRFIYQIIYESDLKHRHTFVANPVTKKSVKPIVIEKDAVVMEKLSRYQVNNGKTTARFSPSAINTYLACQLKFYFRYVERLYEADEIQDEVNAMVFGNLMHNALENLFRNHIQHSRRDTIDASDLNFLKMQVGEAIEEAFKQHFGVPEDRGFPFEGKNLIASKILEKLMLKILEQDQKHVPFRILGLETKAEEGFIYDMPLDNFKVGLKGVIDRIDQKHDQVRVIDYKTGSDDKKVKSIEALFEKEDPNRNKAAFQVIFYSMLFHEKHNSSNAKVMPAIFNSRELFASDFDLKLTIREPDSNYPKKIDDIRGYLSSFKGYLKEILEEIYNPQFTFSQTSEIQFCKNCPYARICHR